MLVDIPDATLVAEAIDVSSAVAAINTHKPDLVLLDIHLPDGDGFDVLGKKVILRRTLFSPPLTNKHALCAFEFNGMIIY